MAMSGWDLCRSCAVDFFIAEPAEFVESVRSGLETTDEGVEIVRQVLASQPKLITLMNYYQPAPGAQVAA